MKPIIQLPAAAILTSALALPILGERGTALGQTGGGGRIGSERRERERRESDLRQRQFNLRMLEKELRRPVERHEPQLALTQIREDFMRLQAINNDMAQANSQGGALDLKFIAKSAAEIKKRAGRLKYNLVLPEPEKGTKRPKVEVGAEPEQLKTSLSALGELIVGFVNNPVFKSAGVVDAELSAKARRDLEGIIELSAGIKKSSERLNKVAQKSQ